MSAAELAIRILAQAEPLLPYMLAAVVPTALLLPLFLRLGSGLWVNQRRFRWIGLFVGLDWWDCLRLACSWIKLLLLISFLTIFRKMNVPHYLLFVIPGALQCFSRRGALRIPGRLLWLALELAALMSCNMVCGYIRDVSADAYLYTIYACIAIFTALFGIYLFLTELNDISEGRSMNFEYEWDPAAGTFPASEGYEAAEAGRKDQAAQA